MLNTDRTTAAIAADAGFADASHLHRQFVQQFACTPAEYRERRKVTHRVRSSDESDRNS
jgi:AraC-like DNA-binding protein